MGLNIKNDATEQAIRALASATGESLTQAVAVAVRERLERIEQARSGSEEFVERVLALGRRNRALVPDHLRGVDLTADLYGDDGLPA